MALLASLAMCGTALNIWLYCDDIRNRGGQLDKVHGPESVTEIIKTADTMKPKGEDYVEVEGEEYDGSEPVESPYAEQ